MSGPTDSTYSEDWQRIARRDWGRVQLAISGDDFELAAFLLQQSLEKYLKAFLLDRGWKLRRVRLLNSLLDAAVEFQGGLETYRDLCERCFRLLPDRTLPAARCITSGQEPDRKGRIGGPRPDSGAVPR